MDCSRIEDLQSGEMTQQHLDPNGHCYAYGDKVIRVISHTAQRRIIELLDSELLAELILKKYLVGTKIFKHRINNCLALEHERIKYDGGFSSWSYSMLKDAAILVMNINDLCNSYGYELKDAHASNVIFDGVSPIWVDFGSIRRIPDENMRTWVAVEEFKQSFIFPLILMNLNCDNLAMALKGIPASEYHLLLSQFGIKFNEYSDSPRTWMDLVFKLEKDKSIKASYWSDYQDKIWTSKTLDARFAYELNWIKANISAINSMVEIGANQGAFSYAIALNTSILNIAATDYDRCAIEKMYLHLKSEGITKITPAVLDVVRSKEDELEKYKSDLLVANALTHHLLLTQGLDIDVMFKKFSALTNKYVIVEFMPKGVDVTEFVPAWYNLNFFLDHMCKMFDIISVFEINKMRTIVIGRKAQEEIDN